LVNLVDIEITQKNVLYLLIILKLKLSANDKENENNQKTPVKADRPPKQVGALASEMPIKVAKNINTMLKEVSINKKKIKDKNALARNDSVIVEHVIQDENRRVLSRNDIDFANKATKNNF
jgi:hypothetical protein